MNRTSIERDYLDHYQNNQEQAVEYSESLNYLSSPMKEEEEDLDFDDSKYDYESLLHINTNLYDVQIADQEHIIFNNPQITLESYFNYKMQKQTPDVSQDCFFNEATFSQDLIHEIEQADFQTFAHSVIKQKKILFGCWRLNEDLKYKKYIDLTKCSLTVGNEQNDKIKIIMTHLLSFTKEIDSKSSPVFHVKKIIDIVSHENQFIKDEIFMQVIKQLNQNKTISVMYYYQFMAAYCTAICPSTMFFKPILNFYLSQLRQEDSEIYKSYCKFILKRTYRTFQLKIQIELSEAEIFNLINLKPIVFGVSIYKNNFLYLEQDTQLKCAQILDQICDKLVLRQRENLYLSLVQNNKEYYLRPEDKLFEIIKILANTNSKLSEILPIQNKSIIKLIIKCFKIQSIFQDLESFNLAYMIAMQDYINDYYTLNDEELILICSLKLAADLGPGLNLGRVKIDISDYIPFSRKSISTLNESVEKIYKQYLKLKIQNRRQARSKLLEILAIQPRFLAQGYDCQYIVNSQMIRKIKMYVGSECIKFSQLFDLRETFSQIEYDQIISLNLSNPKTFSIKTFEQQLYLTFNNHIECQQCYELTQKYMRSLLYNDFQYNSY